MVKYCGNCGPHPYQDKKYGQNMRVCNWGNKGETWRCTVCGKDVAGSGGKKKAK